MKFARTGFWSFNGANHPEQFETDEALGKEFLERIIWEDGLQTLPPAPGSDKSFVAKDYGSSQQYRLLSEHEEVGEEYILWGCHNSSDKFVWPVAVVEQPFPRRYQRYEYDGSRIIEHPYPTLPPEGPLYGPPDPPPIPQPREHKERAPRGQGWRDRQQ